MHKVTVLMSVYNGEKYLREAIDSILRQTFKNFEFLIVDDGSTDSSADIVRLSDDPRIRLVQNGENIGLIRSLNKGLKLAKGEYIARMDADDISLPERLEKQVRFLDENIKVGLVSSSINKIDETGKEVGVWKLSSSNDIIKQNLLKGLNQFSHPSSMFRKKCIERVGGYRERFKMAQDYDLWLRVAEEFEVANIEEPLCKYRIRPDSISIKNETHQKSHHNLAHTLAVQRQIFGQDEFGYKPPGELFRLLRRELSKGYISKRRILSKRYLVCAQKCAFINGQRDFRLTLKYSLMSVINNPLNFTAWRYACHLPFEKGKNKLRGLRNKTNRSSLFAAGHKADV